LSVKHLEAQFKLPAQSILTELALALTSGQEIKIAVSAGHVIIWNDPSASLFINPDDHENCRPTCGAIVGSVCADAELCVKCLK